MRDEIKARVEADFEAVLADLPSSVRWKNKTVSCIVSPTSDQLAQDERGAFRARQIEIVAKSKEFSGVKLGDTITLEYDSTSTTYIVQAIIDSRAIVTIRAAIVGVR